MRIAVLTGDYPRWSERFILRDAAALAARGHELWIWPVERRRPEWLRPLPADAEPADIVPDAVSGNPGAGADSSALLATRPTDFDPRPWTEGFGRRAALKGLWRCGAGQVWRAWGRWGRGGGVFEAARTWPGRNKPDVVWAHFAYVPMVTGLALARGWGCGFAGSVHARDVWVPWLPGERAVFAADRVVGCHELLLAALYKCCLDVRAPSKIRIPGPLSYLYAELRRWLFREPGGRDRMEQAVKEYFSKQLTEPSARFAEWVDAVFRLCHHGLPMGDYPGAAAAGGGGDDVSEPRFRVLAVARLSPKKGLDVLLDAVSRLRDRGVAVELDIVGAAETRPETLAFWRDMALGHGWKPAKETAADGTMLFTAPTVFPDRATGATLSWWRVCRPESQTALRGRMRRADVFAMPSRVAPDNDRDGIPNVVLEAMASGLPVVGSMVGGIPEALGAECAACPGVDGCGHEAGTVGCHAGLDEPPRGVLVKPDDPEAFADALERLWRDPAERRRLAAAARRHVVERYDLAKTVAALETALREAADAGTAAANRRPSGDA